MNHLSQETSPYLLQHVSHPVDWYPWCEEAIQKAINEDKPIFLSIGYSTCHWCHVMAHESFENEQIADLLNHHFICIKVDREERPDIDRLYMTYLQALTGRGGWPMNIWLTPALKPFFGGTYFPPSDCYGSVGFPSVLLQLSQVWRENRERVEQDAEKAIKALHHIAKQQQEVLHLKKEDLLQHAYEELKYSFDEHWGGFGREPKFPRPSLLLFLLNYAKQALPEAAEYARHMVRVTLEKMALGGLQDHLGGGFHRYAVDAIWQVPHFEKMLYDQAQLVMVYLEAAEQLMAGLKGGKQDQKVTQETVENKDLEEGLEATIQGFLDVAHQTLKYVERDLISPEGGFYAAEDADSKEGDLLGLEEGESSIKNKDLPLLSTVENFKKGSREEAQKKKEGAFYVWSLSELEHYLSSEEMTLLQEKYPLRAEGNIPEEYDVHRELAGKNIFISFERSLVPPSEALKKIFQKLLEVRLKRSRPHRDEKIITAWNGLMISAFVKAGVQSHSPRYLEIAQRAVSFIKEHLYHVQSRTLFRNWCAGQVGPKGFAEDYAFFIQGLLDLYEATSQEDYFIWAEELQEKMDQLFWDQEKGGYFGSAADDPYLLVRIKEDYDMAEPAATSVAAANLLRFSQHSPRRFHHAIGMLEKIFQTMQSRLEVTPTALPHLMITIGNFLALPVQKRICDEGTCGIDKG